MNSINWGGSQFDKSKAGLIKSPLDQGVGGSLRGITALASAALFEEFSKSNQVSDLGLMGEFLPGCFSKEYPAPVFPETTKDLKAIAHATKISGIHGNVLKSLEGTGIAVSSPVLGAGLGAVLHLQSSPSGVEATLRDADGSVTQLPAKSSSIGVEVRLDQDRHLNLYSSLGTENLFVSNSKGGISLKQQGGSVDYVGVEKHGVRGEGGVLNWHAANDASSLTPGQSAPDYWKLSDDLTQKRK